MNTTCLIIAVCAMAGSAFDIAENEDYGGAAADWKPPFKVRGFNLQGMRKAGPNAGFREEYFKWMKEWGFNFVRMPLDYRCWVKDRKSANKDVVVEAGLKPLDDGIAWARKYGLTAMICLHRIPGEYCVMEVDPEPGNIYKDEDCLRSAVMHWTMLARRYKDVPREALFFNLINEPARRLGSIEDYERVCRVLIAAIRREDPKRFIVADGWDGGNLPTPGLCDIPGVGQAGRGYQPYYFTHFGFTAGDSIKDDKPQACPPSWPPPKDMPDGRLGGPRWPDWHAPFTVKDAPAAEYTMRMQWVSGPVVISVKADGSEVASFALEPKEDDPDWMRISRYQGKGALRGMYMKPLSFALANPAGELSIQVVKGDWAKLGKLIAARKDGAAKSLDVGVTWGVKKNIAWNRRFAGWDASEPFPAAVNGRDARSPSAGGTRSRFSDEGMNAILNGDLGKWEGLVKKGVWCIVGEFGCANHTPHADSLRFLKSNLDLFDSLGLSGWCAWGFIGSRFGILDSGRADVDYEDWHGHKLDREMLELLRRYAARSTPDNGWVKHPANPVMGSPELGTCFDLNVVPWGEAKYNNYFSWRPQNCIALSRSEDGVRWNEPVRCLESDPASGWEDKVNRASVWFKDGTYHMWYTGQARGSSKIGYATSTDGVTFVRASRLPVMVPEYPHEGFSVMNPYVRWDESLGRWRMWYASGETYEPNVVCYAESADGKKWEKSPLNPIFVKGEGWEKDRVGGCEVHPLPDGRWVMFYIGYSDVNTARIGAAVSPDGIRGWKRLKANPIVEPTPGEWDSSAVYKPSVAIGPDGYRLWYNGRTANREYIGLVEHKGLDLGGLDEPHNRVLDMELVRRRFDRFAADDEDLYRNAIGNGRALAAIGGKIPLFECPDEDIERTYYFRWWTYRKHLRKTPAGWVVTEFLPDVSWAGKHNMISCPFGHHLREGRWLRDQSVMDDYTRIMMKEGNVNGPKSYLSWPAWATLERAKVTGDFSFAKGMLGDFAANYEAWEKGWTVKSHSLHDVERPKALKVREIKAGFRPERGLFDFAGDREGTEYALSRDGARPLVNAAMWAEAKAIAEMAKMSGDAALAGRFAAKAALLEKNIVGKLWNRDIGFFATLGTDGVLDDVKELHGYAPFYFGMPLGEVFDGVWRLLGDEKGFFAPKGLTFPSRDTPGFAVSCDPEEHECLWNGPSWPYATSIALTALARALQGGTQSIASADFAKLMRQYAAQQVRVREDGGKVAWIDENLDPFTGEWLARKIMIEKERRTGRRMKYRERGKDYNHSTFCDLVISGICGLVPQPDGSLVVKPLAPKEWDWWCVDGVRYHGRDVTVLFDRDGTRYGKGKGMVVLE